MAFLKLFISSLLCVFALDMLWLGVIANNLYSQQIGGLLRKSGESMAPNWPAAVMVYFFIVMGILCFVVPRAQGNNLHGLMWGVLFGAVVYGVYDYTNFSISQF